MLRKSLVIAVALFVFITVDVHGQDPNSRTRDLVAALDKTKYKKKEKANVSIEVYVEIRNEPVVRDATNYSGNYSSEAGEYSLTLQVDGGGSATGAGHDIVGDQRTGFTLKGATINGALLSATKVYENGEQKNFEAVFVNRTVASGKNQNEIATRDTKFGIGFIQDSFRNDAQKGSQNWTSRVFLERR